MEKSKMLEKICGVGYVPVYSVKDSETSGWVVEELCEKKPEIALVLTEDVDALSGIVEKAKDTLVGVGNIMCPDVCRKAIEAGTAFVVSPCFSDKLFDLTAEKSVLYMPICQSFSEISAASKAGVDAVGFYPSFAGGESSLDVVSRHFPSIKLFVLGESDIAVMGNIIARTPVSALGIYRDAPTSAKYISADEFFNKAEAAVTGYETYHIGVNTPSSDDAFAIATELNKYLGLPIIKGPTGNFFVGSDIEVMKSFYRGTNGHIGIRTNKVSCAMYRFAKQGLNMDMSTAYPNPDGSIFTVYIDVNVEFGGFALHLIQKKI